MTLLFVLLLIPKLRKFEVIQFQRIPEGATIQGVIQQVKQRSNNPEFVDVEFVGLYCPKTETELILSRSNDSHGVPTAVVASDETNSIPTTVPTIVIDPDGIHSNDLSITESPNKIAVEVESNMTKPVSFSTLSQLVPPSTPQTQSTAPATPQSLASFVDDSPSPTSSTSTPGLEGLPPPSSSSNILVVDTTTTKTTMEDISEIHSLPTPKSTEAVTDETTTPTTPSSMDTSPILDLSKVGELLVAIPKDHPLRDIKKQCHKILSSPAFGVLTGGINFLQQTGNSTIRQELQQIQNQKLTQNVSKTLTEQHTQNLESNKAYEDQAKDLEARKKAAAALSPTSNIWRPDQHGLSPLDQMRVQQNQKKAADDEMKRTIRHQQHDVILPVGSTTMSPTGDGLGSRTDLHSASAEDGAEPQSFSFSPSEVYRLSIEEKKKAELNALKGAAKQGSEAFGEQIKDGKSLENSSVRQELEQIQNQKLTQNVAKTLVQQHTQNLESNKAYEEQAEDLEARKKAAGTTATMASRPDQHGLSPLDLMRVQQNQKKAADAEMKRTIFHQQHDHVILPTDSATTTTTTHTTDPMESPADPHPFLAEKEDEGEGFLFLPSEQNRSSIEEKKKAELDALKGVAKRGSDAFVDGTNDGKPSENAYVRQELEQIQNQKLTQHVSKTLVQQHAQNLESNMVYEEQAKDLEARKEAASSTATTTTSRPDQHGLSPLDLMRVQQNQKKAADAEMKRAIFHQQHDANILPDSTATTTISYTTTDSVENNPFPTTTTDEQQEEGDGILFVSPSEQNRSSIEEKKHAELSSLRNQSLTNSTISRYPFLGPNDPSRSQPLPAPVVTKNRATRTTITVEIDAPRPSSSSSSDQNRPEITRVLSLQQVPLPVRITSGSSSQGSISMYPPELPNPVRFLIYLTPFDFSFPPLLRVQENASEKTRNNNSLSELEELKSMGLTHSVKSRLVEVLQGNMAKNKEYTEQQENLAARKSKATSTTSTTIAASSSLSAADITLMRQRKEKQSLRQQERVNMGFYTAPPTEQLIPENTNKTSDWKATGQTLTTVGNDKGEASTTTIKEWQAPEGGTTTTSRNRTGSKLPTKKNSPGSQTSTVPTDQGCSCTLM